MSALFQGQSFVQDDGRCLASTDPTPISHYHNGIPVDANGYLCIVGVTAPITHYHQGLPFDAEGRIVVQGQNNVAYFGSGATAFVAGGQMAHRGNQVVTIANFSSGVGYTSERKVAVYVVPVAPLTEAFLVSNGDTFVDANGDNFYVRQ